MNRSASHNSAHGARHIDPASNDATTVPLVQALDSAARPFYRPGNPAPELSTTRGYPQASRRPAAVFPSFIACV